MSSLCGRPHLVFVLPALVTWPTSTSPDMAQQLALLDRLLVKLPEGATPVLHSDSKNVASRFCGNRNGAVSCSRDRVAAS